MKNERLMKLRRILTLLGVAASLWLCAGSLRAQDDNGGPPGGGPPPGGPGGDFDPAQFRQRMMEGVRKNLSITNDDEWSAIQPLVQGVMDARRDSMMGGMRFGGPGGFGGPPPGGNNDNRRGPGGFGPPQSEEQKALEKVLDGHGSSAEIKDALAKFRAAKKDKQAKLEAAQANLKAVLTTEQEGRAVLMGLLQ